jgi:two-component system cell cycle response regulator
MEMKKVVIIDNSKMSRLILKKMLSEQKLSILDAENGVDGITLIKNERPFLIISEFYLPDMTVYELCEKIKADENIANIPIIVHSVEDNESNIKKCLKLGVKNFLQKPVLAEDLFVAIKEIEDHPRLRSETILCVDDSRSIRKILKDEFTGAGYNVLLAENGKEGVTLAQKHKPDLITMDVEMPEMIGYEACRVLRRTEITMHIPIIMMTSHDSPLEREKGFEAGAIEYFIKPFKKGYLSSYVSSLFDKLKQTKTHNILLVEDSVNVSHIIKYSLGLKGLNVITAKNADIALKVLQDTKIHLILCDINMPGMDGFELCRKIKTDSNGMHIPILILTARDSKDDILYGFESGAEDYMVKPFNEDELYARICVHLRILSLLEELEKKNRDLEKLSITDGLTGLYNRRYINERLEMEIKSADRYNYNFCCLMCDLDHFKEINDNHGHQFGDFVLRNFSNILRKNCRETDLIGRYGGEEFIILARNTDQEQAMKLAEKVRTKIEEYDFNDGNISTKITVSIGLSSTKGDVNEVALVKNADSALYHAKEKGRNCVTCIDSIGS